jgi:hypothetical protein
MPIFNQYDPGTASTFQYSEPIKYTNLNEKWGLGLSREQAMKLLGYKENGDLNTFGHVQNVLGATGGPFGWAGIAGRDALAKHISGNSDAMAGIERHQKKDLNAILAGGEIAAGAALTATGAGAAIGTPLIGAGVQQGIKTANMANGGYMPIIPQRTGQNYYQEAPVAYYNPYTAPYDPNEQFDMGAVPAPVMPVNNYTNPRQQWADEVNERARLLREPQDLRDVEMIQPKEKSLEGFYWESPKTKNTSGHYRLGNGGMVNGGSHQSGHDLAIVDKNTGGDTGIRVEGGEMVFSKERTNALRNAYNQKDYNAVMQIVKEQMHNGVNAHKLDGGTNELNLPIPYNPSYFSESKLLTDPNIPVNDRYNFTNWGTGGQPNTSFNDYSLTQSSLGDLQPNIELAGTPTLEDNYGMTPKDYGMTQRQNPEMQYLKDYNAIGTYAKTHPTTTNPNPSGKWTDYLKYAIPLVGVGLGAYASQKNKLPEFTPPAEFNAMMALHKRQMGEGLSAQENMLLDRAIQDTYTTGLNKIYTNSGGNAGAILGNQNALAGDVLNAKIKQAALNADQRKKNQDAYSEDVAKQLSLLQDAYKLKYAQAAGARAAGGNLLGVGLNNAQDIMSANALEKEKAGQSNTFANSLEEYFKNKNKK